MADKLFITHTTMGARASNHQAFDGQEIVSVWKTSPKPGECSIKFENGGGFSTVTLVLKEDTDWFGGGCYGMEGLSLWIRGNGGLSAEWALVEIKLEGSFLESGREVKNRVVRLQPLEEVIIDKMFVSKAILRRDGNGEIQRIELCKTGQDSLRIHFSVKLLTTEWRRLAPVLKRKEPNQITDEKGTALLAKDLKRIFKLGNVWTDVAVQAKDGKVINAHKVILAARSPYFRRLLEWHPFFYSTDKPIVLDICDKEILEGILQWMYTGEIRKDMPTEEAIELATLFEMSDLVAVLRQSKPKVGVGELRGTNGTGGVNKHGIRKIKRRILSWVPLLRYRFGTKPVAILAALINGIYGIYELFIY